MNIGETFHRLTAVEKMGVDGSGNRIWRWRCDCGGEVLAHAGNVKSGHTKSCGCYAKEVRSATAIKFKKTHGLSKRPEYRIWSAIKARCEKPSSISYKNYGARGIQIVEPFRSSFAAFYAEVGPRPSNRHSIDRIDNDGNYSPGNVKWATPEEQVQNQRPRITVARLLAIVDAATKSIDAGSPGLAHLILTKASRRIAA